MAVVRISNSLRPLVGGAAEVEVDAGDLGSVIRLLGADYPGLSERVLDEKGRLFGFVNVFVGEVECRTLDGLTTPIDPDSVIVIVPAVAGG
jgi:molybdopterin synthase sulfur carrier subunit